jgi:methionyl-tRNA formyltransferase
MSRAGAELMVSFHFDQILSAETIGATPMGAVNVHAGLLPRHRGPVPHAVPPHAHQQRACYLR